MDILQERLHIFDTVRQYLYEQNQKDEEVKLPETMDAVGFQKSMRQALYLNYLGILGEFYKRIMEKTL